MEGQKGREETRHTANTHDPQSIPIGILRHSTLISPEDLTRGRDNMLDHILSKLTTIPEIKVIGPTLRTGEEVMESSDGKIRK